MSFEIKTNNEQLILKLSGNVDLTETSDIKDAVKNEPKAGFNSLAVDAGSIDYMDSSAVALLIFSKRVAEENQMRFEISSISEAGTKIIKLAGLDSMFNLPQTTSSDASAQDDQPEISIEEEGDLAMNVAAEENDDLDLNIALEEESDEDISLDFTEEAGSTNDQQKVDNSDKSKENSPGDIGSGKNNDSGSDDFEFKPGTFE